MTEETIKTYLVCVTDVELTCEASLSVTKYMDRWVVYLDKFGFCVQYAQFPNLQTEHWVSVISKHLATSLSNYFGENSDMLKWIYSVETKVIEVHPDGYFNLGFDQLPSVWVNLQ